jgi:hypothetical protein
MLARLHTRYRPLAGFALALAACLACGAAQATGLWKWRDANGRITVSDQPPPREIPDRDILERPAARNPAADATGAANRPPAAPRPAAASPAGPAASGPAARIDPELEARRRADAAKGREAAKAAPPEDPQTAARKRENCERARGLLATLDSGQRMARLNDKGERVVLDDAARAQEARRARDVIASDCS